MQCEGDAVRSMRRHGLDHQQDAEGCLAQEGYLVVVLRAWVQSGGQERACCDRRNFPQQVNGWRKISAQHGASAYVHWKHGQGLREH